MKRITLLSLLLFIAAIAAWPGEKVLTVTPVDLQRDGAVVITYDPQAPDAVLKDPASLDIHAMVVGEDNSLSLLETPMKKSGEVWKGDFRLANQKAALVVFKVVTGEKSDDNDGSFWDALVVGSDGKPVKSAHVMRGTSFAFGGYPGFRRAKDPATAREELQKEMQLYPDNWRATVNTWSLAMSAENSPETMDRIRKELPAFADRFRSDDDAYGATIGFYEQTGDSAKAKEIKSAILARNPSGVFARRARINDASREKDVLKRTALLESILKDFPAMEADELGSVVARLVSALSQQEQFEKMGDILAAHPAVGASVYNQVAWAFIQRDEMIARGVEWARKGVAVARTPDPALKPSTMKKADWEENNAYTLAGILDTYGYGLAKQGKADEAVTMYAEAFTLSKGEDSELNEHYVSGLVDAKMFDRALDVGVECVRKGNSTDEIQKGMKTAFALREKSATFDELPSGSKEKFERLMADSREAMKEEIRKKLQESRMNAPSIDFSLARLDGEPVTLSALKGKVVVVDFWATWCGPCRASFPYLQKVYEKFKDNPQVMILAVNTWERMKEKQAIIDNAKKFMTDNKYTFPVLFDDHAVSDYDVEGIPTKFIIDKKGNIAFKEVGFDGPKMEDELTMQIEMLLAETVGSAK